MWEEIWCSRLVNITFYVNKSQVYSKHPKILTMTGLLIFRGKKAKFRGIFRGKFAEKSANFAGRKSADFWYFCRKKSKFAQKSADFAGFFAEKSQISKDFQRQILRKIG